MERVADIQLRPDTLYALPPFLRACLSLASFPPLSPFYPASLFFLKT